MIPKQAIEKAIEEGWILRGGFKAHRIELLPTAHPSIGYWFRDNTTPHEFCERVDWEEIALDPIFWQALGKALGWYEWPLKHRPVDLADLDFKCPLCNAHRFYDLILTEGEPEQFWKELLK